MKTTVYEDRVAQARKDKKGDDKKVNKEIFFSIYCIAYLCCVTFLPCIQN